MSVPVPACRCPRRSAIEPHHHQCPLYGTRVTVGIMKPCCADPKNREPWEQQPTPAPGQLLAERCKICGCRHFRLLAEPGKIALAGSALGITR